MPIDIGGTPAPSFGSFLGGFGSLSRMLKRDYDPDKFWRNIGPSRQGSLTGGLRYEHLYDLTYNPMKYSVLSPSKEYNALDRPILGVQGGRLTPRRGSFTLDMIDWNANLAQLSGSSLGLDQPLLGQGSVAAEMGDASGLPPILRDPMTYLQERDIDVFRNAPARLFDYAFSPLEIGLEGLGIKPTQGQSDEPHLYPFQKDPTYWVWLRNSTTEQRRQMAEYQADRSVDRSRNAYLRDELVTTFERDFGTFDAMSSGNKRFDYLAKRRLQVERDPTMTRSIDVGGGRVIKLPTAQDTPSLWASVVPFIGTEVAMDAAPIPPDIEAAWRALTMQERRDRLADAGLRSSISDILVTLPAFGGVGAVAGLARAGAFGSIAARFGASARTVELLGRTGTIGKAGMTAARLYDRTLRVSNALMAAGLATATGSWAAQSFAPHDSWVAGAARRIDASRIVSHSDLAGLVNTTGFLSGFYGVEGLPTVFGAVGRPMSWAASKAGLRRGLPDLSFNREMGGSRLARILERDYGISPELQGTALSSEFLSVSMNQSRLERGRDLVTVARGGRTGLADIDDIADQALRMQAAEELLALEQLNMHAGAAGLLPRMMNARAGQLPAFADSWQRRMMEAGKRIARAEDDRVTQAALGRYGDRFFPPDLDGLRGSAQKYLRGLGRADDLAALERFAGADVTRWQQVNRRLHQVLYHARNAEMHTAAEGSLEAAKIGVVSQRHLFADEVDDLIETLTDVTDPVRGQDLYRRLIATKDDIQDLEAQGAFSTPEELAATLDEIRGALPQRRLVGPDSAEGLLNDFQRTLDAEGLWTIAFKPTGTIAPDLSDLAGDLADELFLSYVKLPNGVVFHSPWLEYPMAMPDLIELGNRSLHMAKFDDVFRGWRTYRLEQGQRSALHRRLTSLDVGITPARIDLLHEKLQDLASAAAVPPQMLPLARPWMPLAKMTYHAVDKAIEEAVGVGPFLHRDGTVANIDWRKELTKAYRTSHKLNLSAGVTSHLYSMGYAGAATGFVAHVAYPAFRFALSPFFKAGEHVESWVLNAMRGVNPFGGDPVTEAWALQAGVTHQRGQIRHELQSEPMLAGMTNFGVIDDDAPMAKTLLFRSPVPADAGAAGRTRQAARERAMTEPLPGERPDESLSELYPDQYPEAAMDDVLAPYVRDVDETGAPILDLDGRTGDDAFMAAQRAAWMADERARIAGDPEEALHPFLAGSAFVDDLGFDFVPRLTRAASPILPLDDLDAALAGGLVGGTATFATPAGMGLVLRDRAWTAGIIRGADGELLTPSGAFRALHNRIHRGLVDVGGRRVATSGDLAELDLIADLGLSVELPSTLEWADVEAVFLSVDDIGRWTDAVTTWRDRIPELTDIRIIVPGERGPALTSYMFEKGGLLDRRYVDPQRFLDAPVGSFNDRLPADLLTPEQARFWRVRRPQDPGSWLADRAERTALLEDLIPSTFRTELAQAAAAKLGRPEASQPIIHAYLRGRRGRFAADRSDAELVITVIGPDGQPYAGLGFEDIAEAWKRSALPRRTAERFELHATVDRVVASQGYRAVYTPDGGPHGSLVAYDKGLPKKAHTEPLPDGSVKHVDPDLEQARYLPITFEYAVARRRRDDMLVDLNNADVAGRLDFDRRDLAFVDHRRYISTSLPPASSPRDARLIVDAALARSYRAAARIAVDPTDAALMRDLAGRRARGEIPERWVLVSSADGHALGDADWQAVWGVPVDVIDMMPGPAPTGLDDIAGSAEHLTARLAARFRAAGKDAWDAFWNPVPSKEVQQDRLIASLARQWFPEELREHIPDAYRLFAQELGIPDRDFLEFLVEDRRLLAQWHATGAPADFDALVLHAERYRPGNGRAELDALYQGEEWTSIMEVLRMTSRAASDEAFGVHFFAPYRSTFERSINHPLLGVYPASWAYKVAKEWYRFLFDNDMLYGFRLGMTPAVWIAQMREQQQVAFAQLGGDDLDAWYRDGPLSSSIFLFNLLMPGDWSALPFPLSRSIRDALRGNLDPYVHFQNNIAAMGLGRDIRITGELAAEWTALLTGETQALRRGEEKVSFDTALQR